MMVRGLGRTVWVLCVSFWVASCFTTLKASEQEQVGGSDVQAVRDFIQEMGNQAIQALTDNRVSDQERFRTFREILLKDFDVPGIASYLAGKDSLKSWDAAEQAEYHSLLTDYIVRLYLGNFEPYRQAHVKLKVGRVFLMFHGSTGPFSVQTKIELGNKSTLKVEWRVFLIKGMPKILDVFVEGLSMAQTKKQEFQSILREEGVRGLLEKLHCYAS